MLAIWRPPLSGILDNRQVKLRLMRLEWQWLLFQTPCYRFQARASSHMPDSIASWATPP